MAMAVRLMILCALLLGRMNAEAECEDSNLLYKSLPCVTSGTVMRIPSPQCCAAVTGLSSACLCSLIVSAAGRASFQTVNNYVRTCKIKGCDASILLDDVGSFVGEKTATPNANSARGFEVVDAIKSKLEDECPETVSCADILTLAARDAVALSRGPSWDVPLGRRDSFGASRDAANKFIPSPASDVQTLISAFEAVGLSATDLVVLSGAHTIGAAKCSSFSQRLYNQSGSGQPDINMDPEFLASLQRLCPLNGNANTLARLEVQSPAVFDNAYYQNLLSGKGLLNSDQVLFSMGGSTASAVEDLSSNQNLFFSNFANSMVRLGNISPLTDGEIRTNCRFRNSDD